MKNENHNVDERINIRGSLEGIWATIHEREKQLNERFNQQEASAEFKRAALKEALDEAKVTADRANVEAKNSVEARLLEAKVAADERGLVLQNRIDKLESGGAPFASRLDEGMTKLAEDVQRLNDGAVRAEVVDALAVRQEQDAVDQKRQIRYIGIAAALALIVNLIMFVLVVVIK